MNPRIRKKDKYKKFNWRGILSPTFLFIISFYLMYSGLGLDGINKGIVIGQGSVFLLWFLREIAIWSIKR